MMGRREITFKISMNWLIILIVFGVFLILAFAAFDQYRAVLTFVAAIFGGVAAYVVAINAIEVRLAESEARLVESKQATKAAALEYVHKWNDPSFASAKKNCRETMHQFASLKTPSEKKDFLEGDGNKLGDLLDVLNHFETLSIAIQEGVVDEDVARRFFRSIACQFWIFSQDFIVTRRNERNNARLMSELEWLYHRWKVK